MSALLTLRDLFWAATTLGEIVLIVYLIRRKLVRFALLAVLVSLLHRYSERSGCDYL